MSIDPIHEVLDPHVTRERYGTILDIGGWFIPYPRATHVVDLMPWETRGCKLGLSPREGERFTKETWVTMDICAPAMRLPFPDRFFDFVVCGGTLEDLPDPAPCLAEMQRVGKAGYVRVPTAACELTAGVEDRANNIIGYFHHHWICRSTKPNHLTMFAKRDAGASLRPWRHIPLVTFERAHRTEPGDSLHLFWSGELTPEFLRGAAAEEFAADFIGSLRIPASDYLTDAATRLARRLRARLRAQRGFASAKDEWWAEMLRLSKPYSEPELHRKAGGR